MYVATDSNIVCVIDTSNDLVTSLIAVGNRPECLAATNSRVYVTDSGTFDRPGNTVSVIDVATNTVVATISVDTRPIGVAVALDGRRAYVANNGAQSISVIDTSTDTVTATIELGLGFDPLGVAVMPDGRHVYVVGGSDLGVIDVSTDPPVVDHIDFDGVGARGVAIASGGGHICIADEHESATIWRADTAINTVARVLTSTRQESKPVGIATTPDGLHVYTVITHDKRVVRERIIPGGGPIRPNIGVPVGGFALSGLAVHPDGRLYVTCSDAPIVGVLTPSDFEWHGDST